MLTRGHQPRPRLPTAPGSGIYNHESSIVSLLAPGPHDIIALDSSFGPRLAGRAIVTSRSAHVLIVDTRRLPLPIAAVPGYRGLAPTSSSAPLPAGAPGRRAASQSCRRALGLRGKPSAP